MKNTPKVSIIATFYNSVSLGDFVHQTMKSLLNQTYKNIEILCINDGSQDQTLSQLLEYQKKDNRIIIIDKKNEGAAQYAKAAGQKNATGDFIMLFDHDDELSPNAIELAVNQFIEKPDLQMVGFIVKVCFENKKTREIYNLDEPLKDLNDFYYKKINGKEALQKTIGRYSFYFRGLYRKSIFDLVSFSFTQKLLNADEIVERLILEKVNYIGNCKGVYTHYIYHNSSAKSFNLKKTDIVVTDQILRTYFKSLGYYESKKILFEFVAYKNLIDGIKTLAYFTKKLAPKERIFYVERLQNAFNEIDKTSVLKNYSGLGKQYNSILLSFNFKNLYRFYQFKNYFNL